ncbi:hypothetical protein [Hymenobacter rubripertinctus]|uniref:Uncharacterized protein n=1 Tax=Hymenobacter rubripertinctus TaxID=2029981 RepID=A0A418R454_9BACT|nr:hypothetical protein [Hymenobacter rubripertinctus]RIY12125.1 hypothetical protein D0T11_05620 [Hymenobacter rubripertinctus]
MKRPLTRVLVKVMANGFYRQHTGLLLTLFILIFTNFFYTNVLNQTHLTPAQIVENALKLAITTVSEPLGVVLLFGLFFGYTVKSCQYVAGRLQAVDVQFLFYSSNALPRPQQVRSWAVVQSIIALPIIVLGGYALLVGLAFGYWLVPLLIPVYLLGLLGASALYYTHLLNNTAAGPDQASRLPWLRRWPKPFFSLFLYEIVARKRLAYGITKALSVVIIAGFFSVLPDAHTDVRLLALLSLCIALAHVVLVYQSSEFELFYLRFARNLPYSRWQLYGQQAALFGCLVLPEIIWFLVAGQFRQGLVGILLLLSVLMLFRTLLYRIGQRMTCYLRTAFGLFIVFLLLNLFGFAPLLVCANLIVAWGLLWRYRYQSFG